jgi:hypothetical protein
MVPRQHAFVELEQVPKGIAELLTTIRRLRYPASRQRFLDLLRQTEETEHCVALETWTTGQFDASSRTEMRTSSTVLLPLWKEGDEWLVGSHRPAEEVPTTRPAGA